LKTVWIRKRTCSETAALANAVAVVAAAAAAVVVAETAAVAAVAAAAPRFSPPYLRAIAR
jgi:hypothetical protein